MKIAYISNFLNIHDYRGLEKLVSKGYETTYITFNQNKIPDYIDSLKGLEIFQFNLPFDLSKKSFYIIKVFKKIVNFIFVLKKLRWIDEVVDPDVVHSGYLQQEGFWAVAVKKKPTLMVIQGSDIFIQAKDFLGRIRAKYVLKRSDWIACDCQHMVDAVWKVFPFPKDKISVFPWGIDLNLFRSGDKNNNIRRINGWEENPIVISTRSHSPVYSVETLIDAIPIAIKENPKIRFIITGDGPNRKMLENMAKQLGVWDFVKFMGAIPNDKLPEFLCASDIYVSTSKSDGTSLSLLEAMACKLPVVLTDLPPNKEWIVHGEGGYVYPVRNHGMLAKYIIELIGNSSLRHRMGEENLNIVRRNGDWDKNFLILEQIYHKISEKDNNSLFTK